MSALITLEQAIEETEIKKTEEKEKKRNLLLGNGFSISQTKGKFSYGNLLQQANFDSADPVKKIFEIFNTVDFEQVIEALEHAAVIEDAYADNEKKQVFEKDAEKVREALIQAIKAVHPSIQFEIPSQELKACGDFLSVFQNVFTLNYDLLMYWVNLNYPNNKHTDGFGLSEEINGFRNFSEEAYCSIFYLHGGLHLFQSEDGGTKKKISTGNTILSDIERVIRKKKLPLFVAEGTSKKKLSKINSNPYLKHGLDILKKQSAPIFIFGHSADPNDKHIYDAIFHGKTEKVYFCVFDPPKQFEEIQKKLAPYLIGRSPKQIAYIDASKMNVWGISKN